MLPGIFSRSFLRVTTGRGMSVSVQEYSSSRFNDNIPSIALDGPPSSTSSPFDGPIEAIPNEEPSIPEYHVKSNESLERIRARLVYQSRKRGMLENCLLLSGFSDRYLRRFSVDQLKTYDTLINLPSNDWEIYYWIVGMKPVPTKFQSDVMTLLQDFARNEKKESRFRQPELRNEW